MSTPESSPFSFENMSRQIRASAGNRGDKSPVIPECSRGLESRPLSLQKLREELAEGWSRMGRDGNPDNYDQVPDFDGDGRGSQGQNREPGQQITSHAQAFVRFGAEAGLSPEAAQRIGRGRAEGGGAEHAVYYDPDTRRVTKLTSPGTYGAQGADAGAYWQRLHLANRIFGDGFRFEGYVKLPGEPDARAIVSQPAVVGRDSTPEEVGGYLSSEGFFRIDEGTWMNPVTELTAWDVDTRGNALTDNQNRVHPIDFQIEPASELDRERWQKKYNPERGR